MQPLVSILIPAHNAGKWIADTIRSALAQTWSNKEIIVVDDGSQDQTLAVARTFTSRHVKVLTQKNQGAAAARNKAFSICQGDYIQWLDADDLLSSDKIALQMDAARQCPSKRTAFSGPWGYFMYRPAKAQFSPTALWADLPPLDWLLRKLQHGLFMANSSWLVSRELTQAAGPWDVRLSEDDDGEYFCRLLAAGDGTRFVPGAKVFYRRSGGGSLSHLGQSQRKMDSHLLALELQIRILLSLQDSERTRAACLAFLQDSLMTFHPERPDVVERMRQVAASLGGRLQPPRLSWKYAWIQKTMGWPAAKAARRHYNLRKSAALRVWDEVLFRLERRNAGPTSDL